MRDLVIDIETFRIVISRDVIHRGLYSLDIRDIEGNEARIKQNKKQFLQGINDLISDYIDELEV